MAHIHHGPVPISIHVHVHVCTYMFTYSLFDSCMFAQYQGLTGSQMVIYCACTMCMYIAVRVLHEHVPVQQCYQLLSDYNYQYAKFNDLDSLIFRSYQVNFFFFAFFETHERIETSGLVNL